MQQEWLSIIESIDSVSAAEWDALISANDPFCTHAFLKALEDSQSVGTEAGWLPVHVVLRNSQQLLAGLPLYLKNHSYGEYIFDWGWAEAAERARLPYYPKLVSAIPFTPATGSRFCVGSAADVEDRQYRLRRLWEGGLAVLQETDAHSLHVLFLEEEAQQMLLDTIAPIKELPSPHPRLSFQYHWQQEGLSDFDEWLSLFRSSERKKTRKERRKAQATVDTIRWIQGAELSDKHVNVLWSLYQDTCARKWGQPYLQRGFFEALRGTMAELTWVCVAEIDEEIEAMALFFQRGKHLYGRYWGCRSANDGLHFELCYHQAIELCIANGWTRFEAGAQGEHKLKRGLLPQHTHSLHWLRHPGLHHGVGEALKQESRALRRQLPVLAQHGPFKRENP